MGLVNDTLQIGGNNLDGCSEIMQDEKRAHTSSLAMHCKALLSPCGIAYGPVTIQNVMLRSIAQGNMTMNTTKRVLRF